jgi:hypothetical protein
MLLTLMELSGLLLPHPAATAHKTIDRLWRIAMLPAADTITSARHEQNGGVSRPAREVVVVRGVSFVFAGKTHEILRGDARGSCML